MKEISSQLTRLVAVMLRLGIAVEEVLELVRSLVRCVRHLHDILLANISEPALLVSAQNFGTLRRLQELAPLIQDLLQHAVDTGIEERRISTWSSHRIV